MTDEQKQSGAGLTQASGFQRILKTRKEMTRTQGLDRTQIQAKSLPAGHCGVSQGSVRAWGST